MTLFDSKEDLVGVEHNQIPYKSTEIICTYWYPEIEDDELQIITICMCALMYDNHGVGFFTAIDFAKNHSGLTGVELFKEFIQTSFMTM